MADREVTIKLNVNARALSDAQNAFRGLGKAAGGGGGGDGGATGGAIAAAGTGIGLFITAVAGAVIVTKKFTDVMWQGIGLAAPAVMYRFNVAMEDTIATIGGRFAPVVDFMTSMIQDVGDLFANILPNATEFRSLMGELKDALAPVKEAFMELAPLLKEGLTAAVRGAAMVIKWFGENVIRPAAQKVKEFAEWLGIVPTGGRATSHGAAVRDVNVISNLEDVFTQAARAGLMSANGAAAEPINLPNLSMLLEKIETKLEGFVGKEMLILKMAMLTAMLDLTRALKLGF